jgi:hypothetical protein
MQPTNTSMYFPAQGLVLAAGSVLLGHPWFGQLPASALMCGAIWWTLQAWVAATWTFLGGLSAVVNLGHFSNWINTYHAGENAALGGALMLGALPRQMKTARSATVCCWPSESSSWLFLAPLKGSFSVCPWQLCLAAGHSSVRTGPQMRC